VGRRHADNALTAFGLSPFAIDKHLKNSGSLGQTNAVTNVYSHG